MYEPVTESTTRLVDAAQSGNETARERLFAHCRPLLQRWARGRLPGYGRNLTETEDIVQVTLIRASKNLERFEHRASGSFLAYLRTILLNAVKLDSTGCVLPSIIQVESVENGDRREREDSLHRNDSRARPGIDFQPAGSAAVATSGAGRNT